MIKKVEAPGESCLPTVSLKLLDIGTNRVNLGSPAVAADPEKMADCSCSHARCQQHPDVIFAGSLNFDMTAADSGSWILNHLTEVLSF